MGRIGQSWGNNGMGASTPPAPAPTPRTTTTGTTQQGRPREPESTSWRPREPDSNRDVVSAGRTQLQQQLQPRLGETTSSVATSAASASAPSLNNSTAAAVPSNSTCRTNNTGSRRNRAQRLARKLEQNNANQKNDTVGGNDDDDGGDEGKKQAATNSFTNNDNNASIATDNNHGPASSLLVSCLPPIIRPPESSLASPAATGRACLPGDNLVSSTAIITSRAPPPRPPQPQTLLVENEVMSLPSATPNNNTYDNNMQLNPGAYSDTGFSLQRAPKIRYSLVGSAASQQQDSLPPPPPDNFLDEENRVGTSDNDTTGGGGVAAAGGGRSLRSSGLLEEQATITSNSQLAVATMVEDTRRPSMIPVARESDCDVEEVRQKNKVALRKKLFFAGLILLVTIVAVTVAVKLSTSNTKNDHDSAEMYPSSSPPTTNPTGSPTRQLPPMENLELLYDVLPDKTKESLYNIDSPQYEAWEWLLNHPNVTNFEEWRKTQIFAMATFFYSFEGPKWPEQARTRWMNVSISECSWTLTDEEVEYWFLLSSDIFGPTALSREDIQPCNEYGELHNLGLSNIYLPNGNPSIPPEIELLPSLKILAILYSQVNAKLSDLLVPELVQLPNLVNLNFQGSSDVSGTIPTVLASMTGLRHLTLGENELTGSIPSEVSTMTSLEYFNVNSAKITGTIPTDLGLLTKLTRLILFATEVAGPIPTELGLLSNMIELGVSMSRLTGSIPSELGLWTSVEEFWVRDNVLTGPIPSELGLMTSCVELVLGNHPDMMFLGSHNNFTGSLPSELWELPRLEVLDLPNLPNLSGSIPTEVMPNLTLLRLDGSPHLSGTIADEICFLQDEPAITLTGHALGFDCSDVLCGCDCECIVSPGPNLFLTAQASPPPKKNDSEREGITFIIIGGNKSTFSLP